MAQRLSVTPSPSLPFPLLRNLRFATISPSFLSLPSTFHCLMPYTIFPGNAIFVSKLLVNVFRERGLIFLQIFRPSGAICGSFIQIFSFILTYLRLSTCELRLPSVSLSRPAGLSSSLRPDRSGLHSGMTWPLDGYQGEEVTIRR
jgi:hypothetical protein